MKRSKDEAADNSSKINYFDSYTKNSSGKVNYFDSKTFNIWNYLRVEMFGIGEPGTLEPPNQAHIENFFLVPLNLESLIFLGFFICLDAFLYVITYLPIRVVFSTYLLVVHCNKYICSAYLSHMLPFLFPTSKDTSTSFGARIGFHRTQGYDIMRGLMFVVGCITLRQINMSQVYHFIRGQSMIKLYVLTSMLEIFDKLLSSFGQDAFDALHRCTRSHPRSFQLFITFLMVTGYVSIHSTVYFFHVATLTVVINSVDSALITVLILNNFAEMKTFILKKFDCNNLFQLACSDITERFQTFLFLVLILIVALAQAGTTWTDTLYSFSRIGLMMLVGECFADWFKHAFINKFNMINATVYQDFAYVLRNDILSNQKDEIILDHTYSVTRRLGLSQIPLGCVCVRYLNLALVTPAVQMYMQEQSTTTLLLQGGGVFAGLVLLKVFIGVGLVFYAAGAHKRDAAVFLRSPAAAKPSDRISSGSGTGTFHSAAPPTPQPQQQEQQHQQQAGGDKAVPPSASVTPQSTPRVAVPGVGQHPPPGSFRAPPSAGIAGLVRQQQAGEAFAASPSSTPTALSSVSVGSQVPPHAGHASQGSPGRPRGHSITNPFAEARVTGDEVRMAVLVSGIEGATEFVAAQLEQQQQYVGLDTNIIPNITDQNSAESQSSNSSNNNSNNNSNYSSSERGVVGAGEWVPGTTLEGRSSPPNSPQRQRGTVTPTQSQATVSRNRPPLGKLNTHGGKAERASSFTEGLATPPKCMSPPSRPPAPHSFAASSSSELAAAATPLSSEAHTHADSTQTSHLSHSHTSTPVVHLDAHAFTHAQAQSTTSSLHPQQVPGSINISNSRFIDVPDGTSEQSDLEETRSNFSDAPRMAALEDQDAARLRERLEFMEELSSIERYTVYKGRII